MPSQARDPALQNYAAQIRLRAERRAGQLLIEMETTGLRQAKERGRPKKVSLAMTLPELGITRDQSSKWQRIARAEESTFEEALSRIRRKLGELTTAGVLREMAAIERPKSSGDEPNVNVVASRLIRQMSLQWSDLQEVIRGRSQLNPTVRRDLISTLNNFGQQGDTLASDFVEVPMHGKAHQRMIRESVEPEPDCGEAEAGSQLREWAST